MKIWSILEYLVFFLHIWCFFGIVGVFLAYLVYFWRIWCFALRKCFLVACWCLVWCIWHAFITKDVQISHNKLCWKQSLLRFWWKKVHRLEKNTPPPVVRLWTNMRYLYHTFTTQYTTHISHSFDSRKKQLCVFWPVQAAANYILMIKSNCYNFSSLFAEKI